jgi:hypothetical protein
MRHEPNLRIEGYRRNDTALGESPYGANHGFFVIGHLRVISSGQSDNNPYGRGWEHVSVSCVERCPTWEEMAKVKSLFWDDDETVIQFHPKRKAHINVHPNCLHLWKQEGVDYELPPRDLLA